MLRIVNAVVFCTLLAGAYAGTFPATCATDEKCMEVAPNSFCKKATAEAETGECACKTDYASDSTAEGDECVLKCVLPKIKNKQGTACLESDPCTVNNGSKCTGPTASCELTDANLGECKCSTNAVLTGTVCECASYAYTTVAPVTCAACTPVTNCVDQKTECTAETAAAGTCSECKASHFSTADKTECTPCADIGNCAVITCTDASPATATCTRCADGYFPADSKTCTECTAIPECADGQTTCKSATDAQPVCGKCNEGFFADGSKCTKIDSCHPNRCGDGVCTDNNSTTDTMDYTCTCNAGNFLDTTNNTLTCTPCAANPDTNCLTPSPCNTLTGAVTCAKCKDNFYPKAGVCRPCQDKPANCAEPNVCGDDGTVTCKKCDADYFPQAGKCVLCPAKPEHCAEPDVCSDDGTVTCKKCDTDYFPQAGKCVLCPAGNIDNCSGYSACDQTTGARTCTTCVDGYYVKDDACTACSMPANCKSAVCSSSTDSRCNSCANNYFSKLGVCTACTAFPNCNATTACAATPDADATCVSCKVGFTNVTAGCIADVTPNSPAAAVTPTFMVLLAALLALVVA